VFGVRVGLLKTKLVIGADFHWAMVATAPGEKLLIGRRPVRNWTRRSISSLFLCRKLHFFSENEQKLLPFDSNMQQIVCRLGLCPRPHWGSFQPSPRPRSCFRGPTSKGRGRDRREGEGERRVGRGEEGERKRSGEGRGFVLCPRKKKKSRLGFSRLRNDQYYVEWGVKLYSNSLGFRVGVTVDDWFVMCPRSRNTTTTLVRVAESRSLGQVRRGICQRGKCARFDRSGPAIR